MEAGKITPLINGREYSWSDIRINMLGRTLVGVTAVKYEDEQEKEMQYGAGEYPVAYGDGKYSAQASITLQMKELVALQQSLAPGKRLQDIGRFDINVSYLNPEGAIVTDTIHNCQIKNNGRDVKSGDTVIEKELDLMVSHITWSKKS